MFRFTVEFFREADIQKDYYVSGLTEGQILSIPMICIGIIMMLWAYSQLTGEQKL
jgi:phosphatidylglycerol:prolipoprotein diacylglycerol transferase